MLFICFTFALQEKRISHEGYPMCPVNATLVQIMSFAGATEMQNFLNVIKSSPGSLRFA